MMSVLRVYAGRNVKDHVHGSEMTKHIAKQKAQGPAESKAVCMM